MMQSGRGIMLGIGAVLALAGEARAQTQLLAGVVKDSLGTPIGAAAVSIGAEVTRTEGDGTFVIALPRADSITVSVRRLGFQQVTFTLSTAEAAGNTIEVVMHFFAQSLSAVEVQEREFRAMTILRNFDERRENGLGVYLSREYIESRNTSRLADLLRNQRGVVIGRGGDIRFARQGGRACVPDVYVDGQFTPGLPLSAVFPADVEGIELYSGLSQLPAEFMRAGRFNCGALVLWTRRPIVTQTQQQSKKP